MTIRRLSVAKMNLVCCKLLVKHKQINGAPLYRLRYSLDIRPDRCRSVCGADGTPGNQSCNETPFGIWHFYHGEVNTVGRPGE